MRMSRCSRCKKMLCLILWLFHYRFGVALEISWAVSKEMRELGFSPSPVAFSEASCRRTEPKSCDLFGWYSKPKNRPQSLSEMVCLNLNPPKFKGHDSVYRSATFATETRYPRPSPHKSHGALPALGKLKPQPGGGENEIYHMKLPFSKPLYPWLPLHFQTQWQLRLKGAVQILDKWPLPLLVALVQWRCEYWGGSSMGVTPLAGWFIS